jgi:hypothetical protein
MDEDLKGRIYRAKELLSTCKHASMATVNQDGSPHNTPFLFLHDSKLEYVYWGSHPESLHSLNVLRTGKIFVVLYDAIQRGGLYIKAENGRALDGEELKKALAAHNEIRSKESLEPLEFNYYTGDSPQRMWSARITNFWVNDTERDVDGHVIKDGRREISANDLFTNSF